MIIETSVSKIACFHLKMSSKKRDTFTRKMTYLEAKAIVFL